MSAVEFRDVRLTLGGRTVLTGVSLDIAARAFVGLLGPNGSGKTTLMRAILGLVPPSQGSIRVLGRPAARGNPAVGYMPQVRAAVASMTLCGWDFVAGVVHGHRPGLPILGKAGRIEVERALDLGGARDLAGRGHAALGAVEKVITGPVLSRLYGSEIDVVRLKGRIFVLSGSHDAERDEHRHQNGIPTADDDRGGKAGRVRL